MARIREKTGMVPEHIWKPLMSLFGSLTNAQEKLRLKLPQTELREALRGFACRPDVEEMIRNRWLAWSHQNLRGVTLGVGSPNNFRVLLTQDPIEDDVWSKYMAKEGVELRKRILARAGKKGVKIPESALDDLMDFAQRDVTGNERADYAAAGHLADDGE